MSGLNISASGLPTSNSSSTVFSTPPFQNGTGMRNGTVDMATRNVTNDSDRVLRLPPSTDFGPQINFTIWLLTALSSAFLALRLYCKFLRHRGLWWDDHLLILAWLALVADGAFISACINIGFGRPLSQFNPHNLDTFLLFSNLAGTLSILAALWSKTSFAVTVLRISSGWLKALVWFIIITVNACLGVAVAITWAQCTPIEKVWHPLLPGECWPKGIQIRYNIFTAIYSGAMDIVLAVVPWKIIWTLTMNRKEKIGVMVAMSMGVFAGVTSIIKVTQLPSISNSTFTESTTQLVILAAAESAITIIAASIPILRALIRDSRPPPGPAQFYHSLDFSLYTGTGTGTGHNGEGGDAIQRPGSRTVITSAGNLNRERGRHSHSRSRSQSRSLSRSTTSSSWDKEAGTAGSRMHSRMHSRGSSIGTRLSRLSRFSGLSVMVMGGDRDRDRGRDRDRDRGTGVAGSTTSSGGMSEREWGGASSHAGSLAVEVPSPPPGRIVTTEEVVVEYEESVGHGRVANRQGQGQGEVLQQGSRQEQWQWPGIGRAM